MKGIVFTELIEMVERELGIEVADRMLTSVKTSHDGAYTSVGTYDHAELIRLVGALSADTGIPVSNLIKQFGGYLFPRFRELYPGFFSGVTSAIDFLQSVERYIHVEVRKLYPDAELPSFECQLTPTGMSMIYRSTRPFADLAEGLILACIDHFEDALSVRRVELGNQDGCEARFEMEHVVHHDGSGMLILCQV
jgi:hypothetical protein